MARKKLTLIGNSYYVIIPKLFLEDMGINPVINNEVELEVVNKVLHVKKIDKTKELY